MFSPFISFYAKKKRTKEKGTTIANLKSSLVAHTHTSMPRNFRFTPIVDFSPLIDSGLQKKSENKNV